MGRSRGLGFDRPSASLEDVDSDSAEKAFAWDSLSISKKSRCLSSRIVQAYASELALIKQNPMNMNGRKKLTIWSLMSILGEKRWRGCSLAVPQQLPDLWNTLLPARVMHCVSVSAQKRCSNLEFIFHKEFITIVATHVLAFFKAFCQLCTSI
jgi:hypothetical protein